MLDIVSKLYLGNSEENIIMHTHRNELLPALMALLFTFSVLAVIAAGVEQRKYNSPPPSSSFRLL